MARLNCAITAEASADLSLQFLVQRLSWPIPMARWRAARALRDLINDPVTRAATVDALLAFLATRELEVEAVAVLNVLFLASPEARPAVADLLARINRPSVLANELMRQMYGERGRISWDSAHSGQAPADFEVDAYFQKFWTAHVPPVLLHNLQRLERFSGLPFVSQWAYEWAELCRSTQARYPSYAFYFDETSSARSGIIGQYMQRQSDIYRSAYLRTLALAADAWRMRHEVAVEWALDCLPAVAGFFDLDTMSPPDWVPDLAGRCAERPEDLDATISSFMASNSEIVNRLVSLHVPLPMPEPYGDLAIQAHLITADFAPSTPDHPFQPLKLLSAAKALNFDVPLGSDEMHEAKQDGTSGWSLPVGTSVMLHPHGFWQNDYHSAGFALPASYVLPDKAWVTRRGFAAEVSSAGRPCATTSFWLDHWTQSYPKEGNTRCGTLCMLTEAGLPEVAQRTGLSLAWRVELREWRREREFDEFKPRSKRLLVPMR